MRIGNNPEKSNNQLSLDNYHRIIIPVYIPNLYDDYFKDGLRILELCLSSLLHTIHSKSRVTIINNGSCDEVRNYLLKIHQDHECVDQLFDSKENLGKVNALYSAIKSNLEPLITISDADVFFKEDWQRNVEQLMVDFPEAGMVSPVPSSLGYRSKYINSTTYYGFFKGKINFETVEDSKALQMFQTSIGREKMYDKVHLEKYLTVSNKKNKAVIGCGHFVATFRAEVFRNGPAEVCQHKIVGGSETKYLDMPNDEAGFLRMATLGNYAYHLGNTYEPWMEDEINRLLGTTNNNKPLQGGVVNGKPLSRLQYKIGHLLRLLVFDKFKKQYFSFKGVNQPY